MILFVTANPSPIPLDFVVYSGIHIFSRLSFGIPVPVSVLCKIDRGRIHTDNVIQAIFCLSKLLFSVFTLRYVGNEPEIGLESVFLVVLWLDKQLNWYS